MSKDKELVFEDLNDQHCLVSGRGTFALKEKLKAEPLEATFIYKLKAWFVPNRIAADVQQMLENKEEEEQEDGEGESSPLLDFASLSIRKVRL